MNDDTASLTEWLFTLTKFGEKNGLENIRELLRRLGNPQDAFKIIHVAGSDGKGSTCALIESVLRSSGIRTGLFTSPHIVRPNERIKVGGKDISDEDFTRLALLVKGKIEEMRADGLRCTFFEAVTAMAFVRFREAGVEYAVVEVGMGGRFDATNVVSPEVSVITNISLEHTMYLGDTIEKIAFEKAGIIKPGVPAVTCNTGLALEVIRMAAEERGSPLTVVSGAECVSEDSSGSTVRYHGMEWRVGIPGGFQSVNSSLAYEALAHSGAWDRVRDHIAEGMSGAAWPARMQKVDGLPMVVDVTHTAAGMRSFAEDIQRVYGRVVTVFGLLDDKDLTHIAESVASMSDMVIVTHPDSDRALPCDRIADAMREHTSDVIILPCVGDAIEEALRIAGGRTVAVTGSFAMAESAFLWLGKRGRAHISHL